MTLIRTTRSTGCLPDDKLNIVDVEQRRVNFSNSLRTFNSIRLRIVRAKVIPSGKGQIFCQTKFEFTSCLFSTLPAADNFFFLKLKTALTDRCTNGIQPRKTSLYAREIFKTSGKFCLSLSQATQTQSNSIRVRQY